MCPDCTQWIGGGMDERSAGNRPRYFCPIFARSPQSLPASETCNGHCEHIQNL